MSPSAPFLRTATVSITFTPNLSDKLATSIFIPRALAASDILSATTIGIPRDLTSRANLRCSLRFVASTTQTIKSGSFSPATFPRHTSLVMSSSKLSVSKEYAPGKSKISHFLSWSTRNTPDFFSTVTPG